MFIKQIRIAIVTTLVFTVIIGLIYPLAITGIGQVLFPGKANGSLIKVNGKIVGSELIGQPFSDPKYFWSRLSATGPYPYDGGSSSASNFGPLNSALLDAAKKRIQDLKSVDSLNTHPIPVDLVTASGSGLDPHISVAAALYQVDRVATHRNLSVERVRTLVAQHTEGRQFGFLGEARVNVLSLNLSLDQPQSSDKVP